MHADPSYSKKHPETELHGDFQSFCGPALLPDDACLEPRVRRGRPANAVLHFDEWFNRMLQGIDDAKTKRDFQTSKARLEEIVQTVPSSRRERLFAKVEALFANQNKIAASEIKKDQIEKVFERLAEEITNEPNAH